MEPEADKLSTAAGEVHTLFLFDTCLKAHIFSNNPILKGATNQSNCDSSTITIITGVLVLIEMQLTSLAVTSDEFLLYETEGSNTF